VTESGQLSSTTQHLPSLQGPELVDVQRRSAEKVHRIVPRHFPSLDGLRGVAVIMVFFFHYGAGGTSSNPILRSFGALVRVGWAGVTLFFLLSGFLITGILWDSYGDDHWWRNFYARRALRIFPLYYGSLALLLLVAAFDRSFGSQFRLIWIPGLFLQNLPQLAYSKTQFHPLIIEHYWSLAVEEQFYLLWPFLLSLMRSRKQAATLCITVFGLSLLIRLLACALVPGSNGYVQTLPARAGELAIGAWLAIMFRSAYWMKLQSVLPIAAVLGGLVLLGVGVHEGGLRLEGTLQTTVGVCAATVFLAAILARSLEPGLLQRVASLGWLRWIGGISFGIYVYHFLLIELFTSVAFHLTMHRSRGVFMAVRWMVAAVGSICIAWLSFNGYEKPLLRLKRKFSPHHSGA
jgi:peptidoglycan/LPS O-acetylase OafA/YrhL